MRVALPRLENTGSRQISDQVVDGTVGNIEVRV
jgi:hypothetical protein